MDIDDEFFHIGSEFTDINKEYRIDDTRSNNIELLKQQNDKLEEIKRSTPIIMVNPDNSQESIFYNNVNIKLDKTNIDLFKRCNNILKDTDITLANTYEKHKIAVNKRKYIDMVFRQAVQSRYSYVDCKYTYKQNNVYKIHKLVDIFTGIRKALNVIRFDNEISYTRAIRLLGEDILAIIDKDAGTHLIEYTTNGFDLEKEPIKHKDERQKLYDDLNDIVGFELKHEKSYLELLLAPLVAKPVKWTDENLLINEVIDDTHYIDEFIEFQQKMIKSYQEYRLNQRKYMTDNSFQKRMNLESSENNSGLFSVLSFLYYYTIAACTIATNLNQDFQNIMKVLEPTSSKINTTNRLIDTVEDVDPWISCDYHLLGELMKGSGADISRSQEIIKMHNKYVKPNDLFLFLGDISEEEYYDIKNKENEDRLNLLIKLCKQLNGKKIILIGNNDAGTDSFYKKLGFIEIIREPVLLGRHVFSHEPIETDEGILNVHGHIHGSKCYWNVDYQDHIDAYYGLYGHPVKLSFLDDYYNNGKYTGCKTVIKP